MSSDLLEEEKELARLIVEHTNVVEDGATEQQINSKQDDFDKIQEKASAPLKAMMQEKARNESYQKSPIDALVPQDRRKAFDSLLAELRAQAKAGSKKLAASGSQENVGQNNGSTQPAKTEIPVPASLPKAQLEAKKEEKHPPVPMKVWNSKTKVWNSTHPSSTNRPAPPSNNTSTIDQGFQQGFANMKRPPYSFLPRGRHVVPLAPAYSQTTTPAGALVPIVPPQLHERKIAPRADVIRKSVPVARPKGVYMKHPKFKYEFEAIPRTLASKLMLKELAMLIELNAKGGKIRWSFLLQKASFPLRSYIEARQGENNFGMTTLQSIVPADHRETFREFRKEFRSRRPLAEAAETSWKRRKAGPTIGTLFPQGVRRRKILAFKPRRIGKDFTYKETEKLQGSSSGERKPHYSSQLKQPMDFARDDYSDDDDDDFDVLKAVKRSVLADLKKQKFSRRKSNMKSSALKPIPTPATSSHAGSHNRANPNAIRPKPGGSRPTSRSIRLIQHPELSFAERVYNLVDESTKIAPEVLCWEHNGRAFRVKDTGDKLGELLGRHFRHNKYSSFQRQLNMYGFTKHVSGKYLGCFQHDHFRIGSKESLFLIRRRGPPNRRHSFSYLGDEKKPGGNKKAHASSGQEKAESETDPIGTEDSADAEDHDENGQDLDQS